MHTRILTPNLVSEGTISSATMSRLFVLFLCFAPLSAFADSQTSEGSGQVCLLIQFFCFSFIFTYFLLRGSCVTTAADLIRYQMAAGMWDSLKNEIDELARSIKM